MKMKERIQALLQEMNRGIYEKETEVMLALLAAIAGESIIILGPPGVAKSMVARRLKSAFRDARSFEYLMSRFSTPDEIFGPVSISLLKSSDKYERAIDGYLPTADVVFLDEIWKAGPAIQNSLLTALNEKIFRNGREDVPLPLKAVIAASNELPAQGEGLEALWDRFLVRYIVDPIRDKTNFLSLLTGKAAVPCPIPAELPFTSDEMKAMLEERDGIVIPEEILEFLYALRTRYASKADLHPEEDEDEESIPYVSDRRWKKIAGLLRTSALLNGREAVDWSDCLLLEHLLWDNDAQLPRVREDIARELIVQLLKGTVSVDENRWKKAPAAGEAKFWSPDGGVHYAFEAGGELMLIAAEDYERLKSGRTGGRFGENGTILLTDGPGDFSICSPKAGMVTIGSFSYPLRREGTMAGRSRSFLSEVMASTHDRIGLLRSQVDANLFTRPISAYEALGEELRRYGSKSSVR